eukprot:TRINITY_DN4556_c0_g1_i1.p1 TRINITY_DN4556_c0_g1~~TRINITY_DN4556_c0_g1_i1.p1  ORF type:complete len:572 (+),score=84.95 TRINITY_DN4556_c0_g1_i1:125-1840(+)
MHKPRGPKMINLQPMHKCIFIIAFLLVLSIVYFFVTEHFSRGYYPTMRTRPNIIIFVTDDQDIRPETFEAMPNVRKYLRDKGLTFKNFFATTPLCVPSRASILRGQYSHNHRLINQDPENAYSLFPKIHNDTLPVWLKRAGYTNALFGKYFDGYGLTEEKIDGKNVIGSTEVPPGWHRWFATIHSNYGEGTSVSNNGKILYTDTYNTDLLRENVVNFLQNHMSKKNPSPFFLYIATKAPHTPHHAAPEYETFFEEKEIPRPVSFNEDHETQSTKPYPLSKFAQLDKRRIKKITRVFRARLRTLLSVDDLVKDVLVSLDHLRILNNTYIFYTSDNGLLLGEHRLSLETNNNYEESIRTPFIVRGPGIKEGTITQVIGLNIDIAPTIAHIAKARVPNFVDGVSLMPYINKDFVHKRKFAKREVFLVENYGESHPNGTQLFEVQQGIRVISEDQKYDMMYSVWNYNQSECYDHTKDPFQLKNECKDIPPHKVERFTPLWKNIKNCAGETCRKLRSLSSLCLHTPFGPITGCESSGINAEYGELTAVHLLLNNSKQPSSSLFPFLHIVGNRDRYN